MKKTDFYFSLFLYLSATVSSDNNNEFARFYEALCNNTILIRLIYHFNVYSPIFDFYRSLVILVIYTKYTSAMLKIWSFQVSVFLCGMFALKDWGPRRSAARSGPMTGRCRFPQVT